MSGTERTDTEALRLRHTRAEKQLKREREEAPKHPKPWRGTYGEWSEVYLDRPIPQHQEELAEWLLTSPLSENAVDLEPRGHGKSTTASNGLLLFIQCESTCDPLNDYLASWLQGPNDLRILHVSASKELDKLYIKAMKTELEQNEPIHGQYGKILEPPGSTYQYNLKERKIRKEPTIMGVGIGSDVIGHHGDLICIDDCIQDDKPRDEKVRIKKQDWADETLEGCVDPNTRIWWIGTRKSTQDIYQYIMNKPGTVKRIRKAIISERCSFCGVELTGGMYQHEIEMFICGHCGRYLKLEEVIAEVLWVEQRPYGWLVRKRVKMGSFKFSREMQNKPVSEEGGLLKRDWLKEYARLPFAPADGAFYIGVDPAIGEKTQADYTVLITIAKYENRIYIVDVARGRWNFVQTKSQLSKAWLHHKPLQVGLEANFYQRALAQAIINETMMPVVEVRYHRDKVERIMSTVGYYAEVGKLIVNRSLPFKEQFLAEYLDFPDGEHEDILDALATAIEVAVKPVGAIIYVK